MAHKPSVLFIIATVFLFIVGGCGYSPAPTVKDDDYFPIVEGAKWEYSGVINHEKGGVLTAIMSLASVSNGVTSCEMRLDAKNGKEVVSRMKWRKMSDELQFSLIEGGIGNIFFVLLKYPLVVGKTWDFAPDTVMEVMEKTDVVVPFGTFKGCWRIEGRNINSQGSRNNFNVYFASGTGIVKIDVTSISEGTTQNTVLELTNFIKNR